MKMITEREMFFIDTIIDLRLELKSLEMKNKDALKELEKMDNFYDEQEEELKKLEKENEELKNQLTELSQAKVTIMTDSAAKGEL